MGPVARKMRSPTCVLVSLLLVLLSAPHAKGTVALTIGTTTLSATTVSALAGLKLLGVSAGLLLARGASRSRGTRRGRRSSQEVDEVVALTKATAALEQQQCFRRLFCAIATNKVKVQSLSALSSVVKMMPGKFADASKFGAIMQDVSKCEAQYKCSMEVGKMVDAI